jgi:hypothetical protein
MTTSNSSGVHHWSRAVLRAFAPGPMALGMRAYVDPSGWLMVWTKRYVADQPAKDDAAERGEER